eukprot:TRINITY_DN1047_c0_g1_i3.p1 TRINITY_DN1047_c0_g1~~TRINITY_DN1047_c0_g1_i3.p1  ORF type:complete len:155 (-),score=24.20 TRINITY_DN1047_c0_g1_i3:96-560(-)
MRSLLFLCVIFALFGTGWSVCLINPTPRGGRVDTRMPNNPACALSSGPCGGRRAENPQSTYRAGQQIRVLFQKGQDYFYSVNPGSLEVLYVPDGGEPLPLYFSWDSDTTWNFVYEADIKIPDMRSSGYLQVVYKTNNPTINMGAFYQCADIRIA